MAFIALCSLLLVANNVAPTSALTSAQARLAAAQQVTGQLSPQRTRLMRMEGQKDVDAAPRPEATEMTPQVVNVVKLDTDQVKAHSAANPKDDHHLPLWAQVLCGALVTAIIMGIYSFIKGRMQNVVPAGVDSQRLQVVLSESLERVTALKAQLDEQYRNQETGPFEEGEDPSVTDARRARELAEQASLRNIEIREGAARIADQRDELIAGAGRVQDVFHDALETGRERFEGFSKDQATGVYSKMEAAVTEGNIPAWETPEWMAPSDEDESITLPPLLNLIQGAFATFQIHWMKDCAGWAVLFDLFIICASATTFALNWKNECHDPEVWIWHIGLVSIATLDLLCRTLIVRWSGSALLDLHESREKLDSENGKTGNNLIDMFSFLQQGGAAYFEPYFKYHNIADSWICSFVQFLAFVNLCWGGFGLWISVNDVVLDSLGCKARMALIYMHCYSFLYVMFMTWGILSLLLTVVGCFASCSSLNGPMLKAAKSFDDDTMQGIPVALTLIRSLVLKNSSSSIGMKKREVEDEVGNLNKKISEMEKQLKDKSLLNERYQEAVANVRTSEEEEEYCQKLTSNALEQARPLIGLLAANVSTNPVDEVDPTAGSTTLDAPAGKPRRYSKPPLRVSFTAQDTGSPPMSSPSSPGGVDQSEEDPTEIAGSDVDQW